MQNAYHDGYKIELGGEPKFLRLSLASIRVAEEVHGVIVDLTTLDDGTFKPSMFATLVWCALLHDDHMLKEIDVMIQLMKEPPESQQRIQFVLGKGMADVGESMNSFRHGVEASELTTNGQTTETTETIEVVNADDS